jgi:hypothetical protein
VRASEGTLTAHSRSPEAEGRTVEQVWIGLIRSHETGDETMPMFDGRPLLTANYEKLKALRKNAQIIARSLGQPIRIACFRIREDQELIEP